MGNCEPVMVGIEASYPRWREAQRTQERTPFPDIGSNHEIRTQFAAGKSWQHTGKTAVFELLSFANNGTSQETHGTTCTDCRCQGSTCNSERPDGWQHRRNCGKRGFEVFESLRQMLSRESLERFSVQQSRPEHRTRHGSHVAPVHSRRQGGADDTACASSRNHLGFKTGFVKGLDDADVGESTYSPAAQGQADSCRLN